MRSEVAYGRCSVPGPSGCSSAPLVLGHEARAQRRRDAEQVQRQPAVAAVIAHQVKITRRDKLGVVPVRAQQLGPQRPESLREGIVVVRAGDRLHQSAVAGLQAAPIDFLEVSAVRAPVLGDRHLALAGDLAGHGGGPQQLVVEPPRHEMVQLAEVPGQRGVVGEGRRHQLEQRLGIIGRDVRDCTARCQARAGAALAAMRPAGRHPQTLALEAAQAAGQRAAVLAVVGQRRQAPLEGTVCHRSRHPLWTPVACELNYISRICARHPRIVARAVHKQSQTGILRDQRRHRRRAASGDRHAGPFSRQTGRNRRWQPHTIRALLRCLHRPEQPGSAGGRAALAGANASDCRDSGWAMSSAARSSSTPGTSTWCASR